MYYFNDFDNIESIQRLIENKVPENLNLEFKKNLPESDKKSKEEFCKDVSSFSNSEGGIIIYGLSEKEGFPEKIEGLKVNTPDEELRLRQILDYKIIPKISGLIFKWIEYNSKFILILKIPSSINSPHEVSFEQGKKYFIRKGAQSIEMDRFELKNSFLLNSNIYDKIRDFSRDNVLKIYKNEQNLSLDEGSKIIIHFIPLHSMKTSNYIDLNKIKDYSLSDLADKTFLKRFNIDGLLFYYKFNNKVFSYTQFYRNGIVEILDNYWLNQFPENSKKLPIYEFEKYFIKSLKEHLNLYEKLEIPLPVFIFLSMTKVKNYMLYLDNKNLFPPYEDYYIDRDILYLPELILENYSIETSTFFKPMLDSLWNAFGFEKSLSYDSNGNYIYK